MSFPPEIEIVIIRPPLSAKNSLPQDKDNLESLDYTFNLKDKILSQIEEEVFNRLGRTKDNFIKLLNKVGNALTELFFNINNYNKENDGQDISESIKISGDYFEEIKNLFAEKHNNNDGIYVYSSWHKCLNEFYQQVLEINKDFLDAVKKSNREKARLIREQQDHDEGDHKINDKIARIQTEIESKKNAIDEIKQQLLAQQRQDYSGKRISNKASQKQIKKIEAEIEKLELLHIKLSSRSSTNEPKSAKSELVSNINPTTFLERADDAYENFIINLAKIQENFVRIVANSENGIDAFEQKLLFAGITLADIHNMMDNIKDSVVKAHARQERQNGLIERFDILKENITRKEIYSLINFPQLKNIFKNIDNKSWEPNPHEDLLIRTLNKIAVTQFNLVISGYQNDLEPGEKANIKFLLEDGIKAQKEYIADYIKMADKVRGDKRKIAYILAILSKIMIRHINTKLSKLP